MSHDFPLYLEAQKTCLKENTLFQKHDRVRISPDLYQLKMLIGIKNPQY